MEKLSNDDKAKIAAFATIFFWSSSFMFIKIALNYYDSMTLSVLRYIISSFVLIFYMIMKKMRIPELKDIPIFFCSGFTGFALYMITLNKGLTTLSSSTVSVIMAFAPILTSVLSVIFLKEKINLYGWICIFVSFAGIAVLMLWEGVLSVNEGVFLILTSALLLAIYNIIQKKLMKRYTASEATTYSIFTGTILLVLYSPKSAIEIFHMSSAGFIIVFYLAVFVGVVGYILWSKALSLAENTGEIANLLFLNPFIATIMGIIILHEKLTIPTIIGGTMILSGILGYNKFKGK